MAQTRGEPYSRHIGLRIASPVANRASLIALATYDEHRADGAVTVILEDASTWTFDLDSTATASDGVLVPTTGPGRFLKNYDPDIKKVRGATTGALAANTRTGNVLLANANGALGAIDGLTIAVGDRLLVKNEATQANNGIYVVDALGGAAAKFQFTRAYDSDNSYKMTSMGAVLCSAGTANAGTLFVLSTTGAITLNTTALVFSTVVSTGSVSSLTTRVSTEEVARASHDTSLTTRVSTEEVARASHDTSLTTRVSAEEVARDSHDTSLTTRVSAEEVARDSHDTSLTTRVSTEEIARDSHDTSLTTRVSTEEIARDSHDTSLTTRVSTAEATRPTFTTLTATYTSADLTIAGNVQSFALGSIPAGGCLVSYIISLVDAFDSPGAGTCVIEIGDDTIDPDSIEEGFDVYTGSAHEGVGPVAGENNGVRIVGLPTGPDIEVLFRSGVDNLDTFTNGEVTVSVTYITV